MNSLLQPSEERVINDSRHAENRALVCGIIVAAIVVTSMWLSSLPGGDGVNESPVPAELKVPDGGVAFARYHATGTQQYVCLPAGSAFVWTLFAPQATLFDTDNEQAITHFLSTSPLDAAVSRPAWQDSRDMSMAWGNAVASSRDYHYVAPDAIPWLLLKIVETRPGLMNGVGRLEKASYIQRINTSGGMPPVDNSCDRSSDVGKKALVPYRADYVFYRSLPDRSL